MDQSERNPARLIGFIMIGIGAAAVLAAVLLFGEIPGAILTTNIALIGMGIVFVAIGSGASDGGGHDGEA